MLLSFPNDFNWARSSDSLRAMMCAGTYLFVQNRSKDIFAGLFELPAHVFELFARTFELQFFLSSTATLKTEENGRCREV